MRLQMPAGGPERRAITIAAVLLAGALAIAGCGSSKSSSASEETKASTTPATTSGAASTPSNGGAAQSGGTKLSLAAESGGQLKYDKSSLTAKAGAVTIDFTNSAPLEHDVTIASSSGSVVGATPIFQGGTKSVTVNLKPGTYKFYCSVPGHRQAGMEGTLTVQ